MQLLKRVPSPGRVIRLMLVGVALLLGLRLLWDFLNWLIPPVW